MLSSLHIKNIALIDEAKIEFGKGLNVLSGETGSGKSVILDCINFVLGSKADKNMIRSGSTEAKVTAEFVVDEDSFALARLNELDIESDGNIIITRKYSQDGKSSIKINGSTVTAAMLKSVTQNLVDVHGQSEHFFLLEENNQLKVIDDLCREDTKDILASLSDLIDEKRDIKKKISELGGSAQERERTIDILSYQVDEIEDANLSVGELDELLSRRSVLNNAEKIVSALESLKENIDGEDGCVDKISAAIKRMNLISSYNADYADIVERLENLRVELEDIEEIASGHEGEMSFSEDEYEALEKRIEKIRSLIKKYGKDEESVLAFLKESKEKLELLKDGAELLEKYSFKIEKLDKNIYEKCISLSAIRQKAAKEFCERVQGELKSLNIPDAKVDVEFAPISFESADLNNKNGSDKVCFFFSANKGEPIKPLNKVISGGEMSRFMLALKTQMRVDTRDISTYIFDEIDAGISGQTGWRMAEKFVQIAKNTQIIAVSHLAQVCAAGENQYLIYKTEKDGKTVTNVKQLTFDEKVEEIIRLTGSIDSEAARTHALELMKKFNNY